MRSLPYCIVVSLLFAHTALGQTVGMLGDWQKIEFEGLQEVDADAIRSALAGDLKYQAAARPSASLDEFLKITDERITQGFRHSGYARAEVTVRLNHKQRGIIATVNEGEKYNAGEIRIIGNRQINVESLIRALTMPPRERAWTYRWGTDEPQAHDKKDSEPIWVEDELLRMDNNAATKLMEGTRIACADQGYPFAEPKIAVDFTKNRVKLPLNVDVSIENSKAKINKIDIDGLTRHTEAELLDFLDVRPGDTFSADLADRACQRLRDSCRFWSHSVEVHVLTSQGRYAVASPELSIVIQVVEYTHVPKLGEPLPEIDEALRKAADWLEAFGQGKTASQEDMKLELFGPVGMFQGTISACISPHGGWTTAIVGRIGNDFIADYTLTSQLDKSEVFSWRHHRTFSLPTSLPVAHIRLKTSGIEGEEYRQSLHMGVGAKSGGPALAASPLQVEVDPVALVHNAHRTKHECLIKDGIVELRHEGCSVKIEADSGRILELNIADSEQSGSIRVRFERGAFDKALKDCLDRSETFSSKSDNSVWLQPLARFVLDEVMLQPFVKRNVELTKILHIANHWLESDALISLLDDVSARPARTLAENGDEFRIPQPEWDRIEGFRRVFICLPAIADNCFQRGNWAWTLVREFSFIHLSESTASRFSDGCPAELTRAFSQSQTGPIGFYSLARWYESNPRAAKHFAALGLRSLADEDFLKDVSLFVDGELWVPKVLEVISKNCNKISGAERRLLLARIPQEFHTPIESLVARRKSQPDENPREALRAVLLECWRETWRDQMEAEFTRLANLPADRTAKLPTCPYPSTGVAPEDPVGTVAPKPSTDPYPNLLKSLAEPGTAGELWSELK